MTDSVKRLKIILFTLALMGTCGIAAQPARPRLVVTIAIDGLQNDHIVTLANRFDKGGLRKLTEGLVLPTTQCRYVSGGAVTDVATLMTGSWPYYHGIIGEKRYDLVEDDMVPIVYDGRYHGINSVQNVSPKQLAATTLADAVKLNQPKAKVYAIALNAANAVVFGGHTANAAIWLDDETGRLATTDFYEYGLPLWADKVNHSTTIDNYLHYEWRPLYELGTYKYAASTASETAFTQPDDRQPLSEQIYRFKHSPFVNTLMKDLAIRALRDEKMGVDAFTDFLMVEFTVKLPREQGNALLSAEKEDMYLRLDKELRLLFDAIDLSVGLDNTLIVVAGTAEESYSLRHLTRNGIVAGEFNAKRSMALLNAYLMAIYGQGRYVSGYCARNIYLNKSLIEKQHIDRYELEQHVAQFMTEFQGVHNAYTSAEIKLASGVGTDELSRIRNSAFKTTCGDVVFTLLPGWVEVNDRNEVVGMSNVRNAQMAVYLLGNGVPQQICPAAEVTDIAPTVCNLLQIPWPNAAVGRVLSW
ncbi:MAG: alkaline phosphatase family protein [Paludibacteraceae bacterium]